MMEGESGIVIVSRLDWNCCLIRECPASNSTNIRSNIHTSNLQKKKKEEIILLLLNRPLGNIKTETQDTHVYN